MKNEDILQAIMDYIYDERKRLAPEVKDDELTDNGAIYYMNGNDGTDFDFGCNGRTCEFMQFYKSTEYGLIKAYLTDMGYIEGYLWKDEGKAEGIELLPFKLVSEEQAKDFAEYLMLNYDDKNIWDEEV